MKTEFQILLNIKDEKLKARTGLVEGAELLAGDIVFIYRNDVLYVDDFGNFAFMARETVKDSDGVPKLVRLRFKALVSPNWSVCALKL